MSKQSVTIFSKSFRNPTSDKVTVGSSSTKVISADDDRIYALLCNDSDETIYLGLDTAAVMNKGPRLNANGGSYEIENSLFKGEIYAICASGSKNLTYTEG